MIISNKAGAKVLVKLKKLGIATTINGHKAAYRYPYSVHTLKNIPRMHRTSSVYSEMVSTPNFF